MTSRATFPHILVLDDEAAIREGLELALRDTYVVHTAATGEEACRVLNQHPVSAIILDEVLRGEHGLDLVPRFRALSGAPVLILTGYSTEALAIRAIEAQVAGYLKKPPHLGKLRATLERWVDAAAPVDEPLAHVRRLLEAHPERPHTTAALAQAVGLSERHLRRQFRDRYGKTPRRFLTEVRLQTAAHLLPTTSLGIEQIALQVGYQSVSSFSRSFKRVFGMSPSAFREQGGRP